MKKRLNAHGDTARRLLAQRNYNEQYSRKKNIKIFGVKKEGSENTQELVKTTLKEKAGAEEVSWRTGIAFI